MRELTRVILAMAVLLAIIVLLARPVGAEERSIKTLMASLQQSNQQIQITGLYDSKEYGSGVITDLGNDYVCLAQLEDTQGKYIYRTCWPIEAIGKVWYATQSGKQ